MLQTTFKRFGKFSALWRKREYMLTQFDSFIFVRDITNKVFIAGNHFLYTTILFVDHIILIKMLKKNLCVHLRSRYQVAVKSFM